jgi:predicted HD superfamily hydrolase involved in NAD metabolism
MTEELIAKLRDAVSKLPDWLQGHISRVEEEGVRLAAIYDVDPGKIRVAALAHDLARAYPEERMMPLALRYGVDPDEIEVRAPMLLHGPIAASMLSTEYDCRDLDILGAVTLHTTAWPGMSALEKVLFIADKIEPDKVERRPALAGVRDLAGQSLDAAMLRYLDLYLLEALEKAWLVTQNTIAARNEILAKVSG